MIAAYRSIAPSASSLLTRVQQEDGERPTFAASSLLVNRPSLIRADRILRSIKSRRPFFATDGFVDGVRSIDFPLETTYPSATGCSGLADGSIGCEGRFKGKIKGSIKGAAPKSQIIGLGLRSPPQCTTLPTPMKNRLRRGAAACKVSASDFVAPLPCDAVGKRMAFRG